MLAPVPDPPVLEVVPSRPHERQTGWYKLYPKKSPEKDSTYHPAEGGNELVLNRLLLEHLAVVLDDRGIESERNRNGDHERCGAAGQQWPSFSCGNPDHENRPQHYENVWLRHWN